MIASPEDARLFFDRWKQDTAPLKVRLWASTLFFDAMGIVSDFSRENLELSGDSWNFTVPLDSVTFSFSDPREIPVPSVRASETSRYEFGIVLELPNGDRLIIMELKAVSDPGEDLDEES